jgi:hypothetical protein
MSEFDHPNLTTWGYTVDAETLPDFITVQDFNAFTANKFVGDTRIAANIPSATAAIRNYCNWHIYPSLPCGVLYRVQDIRDYFVGSDLLIQLPATFITGIEKIVLNAVYNGSTGDYDGDVLADYELENNGMLRIYDVGRPDRKAKIFIKYQAGLSDAQMSAIKELTAHRVSHAVSSSYGVMSEAAGGVSVTYNSSWAGNTRSTALPDDNREVLEPYRVKGVF